MADLTPEERELVADLQQRLSVCASANRVALRYYEGDHKPAHYGIAVPPTMRNLEIRLGWAGKVVDVNNSRLDFQGWASEDKDDPFGLQEIYRANSLDVVSHQAHLDALIFGTAFVVVGTGAEGEPDPLITVHSPTAMTANYSLRTRRITSAFSYYSDSLSGEVTATLYLPNQTVTLAADRGSALQVVGRDVHNLGRVPVVLLANRARSNRPFGRSEITKSIRSSQDEGVKASINMSVNSEFFAAPQRYVLGAEQSAFADGQWKAVQNRLLAITATEDGQEVKVGQFPQSSPEPYINVINQLARQVASDADLPVRYFDENRNAPTSADAIRADESALVARAKRKQKEFGKGWLEVAELALLIRDGALPDGFDKVRTLWAPPATPTVAASTDAAVKLAAAGIVPADSGVLYRLLDLSEDDIRQLRKDAAKAKAEAEALQLEIAGRTTPDAESVSVQESPDEAENSPV